MPRFSVSPAALETGIDDIGKGLQGIETQLEALKTHLAPLAASWLGSASAAYGRYQQDWDATAAAIKDELATLQKIATIAHRNYTSADAANQRMWGGV